MEEGFQLLQLDRMHFWSSILGGMITGAIPVVVGAMRGKLGTGILGFFGCILAGYLAGMLLAIPVCGGFLYWIVKGKLPIQIGLVSDASVAPPAESARRKCPFCAELIATEAIICKHCQRDVASNAKRPA